ncbi:hypothetical protein V1524DRAFT_369860, partial [Lipomyces starkeyi]
ILARDGVTSPVGKAIDGSAPKDVIESCPGIVANLEAAHIIPFMVSKHSTMQTLLSMFAGTNMESILRGKNINSSRNIFCTDHDTNLHFDEFVIGIAYVNGQYWLRKLVPEKAWGRMSYCQDGEEVIFGNGPEGHAIDLPDGELFNIHLAIGKVLHASGAGETINKILQDEDNYNDGIVTDEDSAARISAFALRIALKRAQAVDSIDDNGDSSNKQQEGGKGILRVATNSQTDA